VEIANQFDVDAPPEGVYALMLDPARVAPCIPGAEVLGRRDDGGYDAQVTVRMGPVRMSYRGTVAVVDHDDAGRTASMRARGAEARGQGNVDATMRMAVRGRDGGGSHVEVVTEMQVTGRVAQMGQGIMQDVAVRMIGEMARNMEALLAAGPPPAPAEGEPPPVPAPPAAAEPIRGGSLILRVLWGRLRGLFGRR
jgi:carbon monoxide dehydrogenase subunit G